KTTLFRLITGQETPDSGSFKVGETVKLGYVDQMHHDLDPEKSVWENITGGNDNMLLGNRMVNSRAYVSKFNFNGADQQKKVVVISGIEHNSIYIVITFTEGSKVILLEVYYNDMYVNTL